MSNLFNNNQNKRAMKAADLMVNNLVKAKDLIETVRVKGYDCHTNRVAFQSNSGRIYLTDIQNIEPIPLTKEIMDKNFPTGDRIGFGEDRDAYRIFFESETDAKTEYTPRMWYVHQLQQMLKVFGFEKDIQL